MVIASLATGGSERVCVRLANYWAAQGYLVELLLVRRQGAFLASVDPRVRISSADVARTRQALFWLAKCLNEWADVPAILFGFDFGVGLGAFKRLGLISAPLIYREGSSPRNNIPRFSLWKYWAFVGAVDGIIAQSKFALNSLCCLGLHKTRSAIIWNPLVYADNLMCTRVSSGNELRLLAAGRLSSEKGFLRLIDIFDLIRDEHPSISLTIAGDGLQRIEIEQRIRDRGLENIVRLTGFVSDMSMLYMSADIFLLSSEYEGQPNALLEALQCGCRVVAAGGDGVGEMLAQLGVPECWTGNGDFAAEFPGALRRALTIEPVRWALAQRNLAILTDIKSVGLAYYQFCHALRA